MKILNLQQCDTDHIWLPHDEPKVFQIQILKNLQKCDMDHL
jgi:hypothetical protein